MDLISTFPATTQAAKSINQVANKYTIVPLSDGRFSVFTGPVSFLCHQGDFTIETLTDYIQLDFAERKESHEKQLQVEAARARIASEQSGNVKFTPAEMDKILSLEIDDDFDLEL